jgi:serine/threonine protein kinase
MVYHRVLLGRVLVVSMCSCRDALNLCKDNKMSEKESLECILQVSKGVQELHNHRITHRDLKPENILLKTKYVSGKPLPLIKLADFGLSTQKIIMETIAGTKEYIAPEQAKFHNYTNAVDVWSLGIIFDEILHGTPFYSG